MRQNGGEFRPLTAFVHELTTTATGQFTVSNFTVMVSGQPVEIPAATVTVVGDNSSLPPPRRLLLEPLVKNIYLGQSFRVRILLPAGEGNAIEALREIQINGDILMTDKKPLSFAIQTINFNGQLKPAFICEMSVTPIMAGTAKVSAQGFTAGREFTAPISITGQVTIPGGVPQYALLLSEAVEIQVHPLPADEPPGFTGAMAKLVRETPVLSTNRLHVGEPIHLSEIFRNDGDYTHFVPPAAPRSREWQIIADKPPASGFTLIPQTDAVTNTPVIPFCAFNPQTGKYYDLTIPALPVTVIGDGLPVNLPALENENSSAAPLKLSGLATSAGKTVASLKPLQLRGWFVLVQFLPVAGFLALWQWDRRRRYWEAHPDLFRRRQARRTLRREKRTFERAIAGQDATAFLQCAMSALRIAAAPHFPAEPRALVCADVLALLDAQDKNGRVGETVRKVFEAADTQFAATIPTPTDLLALAADVAAALQKLEEKL